MTYFRKIIVLMVLLTILLAACAAPTPVTTPDPRPALQTMVAATLEAAAQATGAAPSPTPPPTQAPTPTAVDRAVFASLLQGAIAARDFTALAPMIGDRFEVSTWQAGGGQMSAPEAVEKLRLSLLGSRATISFSFDLPADVDAAAPPEVQSPLRLFSAGWGPDGLGEAILTYGQGEDGRMAWHSVLFAPAGFTPAAPAAVGGVINVASANLRSGPSPLHTLVAPYAMGTRMVVSYATPGRRWGEVTTPDGKEGWLLISLMDLEAPLETLPLHPGTPSDSIPVVGWVQGGSGQPVDQAVVSIWQSEEDTTNRPLAFSGPDGMFYLYLPADSTGTWTVSVVSVDCASAVMDEKCANQAEFPPLENEITLPPAGPVVFVYNNLLSGTPVPAAAGCPSAEPGRLPLSNSQDSYCLLYPEGFRIEQPATNVLEVVGPALNQEAEPLAAKLTIQKKALPAGSSLETVAAALWSEGRLASNQTPITLGGQPGLYADLRATASTPYQVRQAVVIRGDSYYILTFAPWDKTEAYAAALSDIEKLWQAVTASFQFTN